MCNMCARADTPVEAQLPQDPPSQKSDLDNLKVKHNISTDPSSASMQKTVEYQPDLLAVSTQYTKIGYDLFKQSYKMFKETPAYAVATRTTQPLHIALAALVIMAWIGAQEVPDAAAALRPWKALYVGAAAIHLGAQVWMTLVSGIVLYFSIPRHEFGRVQTVLFPVYFAFNAVMSFLTLLAYYNIQCIDRFQNTSWLQFALLSIVLMIEASTRLYFVSPMLKMKHIKTQMEETAGGGQEVGKLILGELAHCPHYMRTLKAFRRYHSVIAMGTVIGLGCSLYNLMIIADSICI